MSLFMESKQERRILRSSLMASNRRLEKPPSPTKVIVSIQPQAPEKVCSSGGRVEVRLSNQKSSSCVTSDSAKSKRTLQNGTITTPTIPNRTIVIFPDGTDTAEKTSPTSVLKSSKSNIDSRQSTQLLVRADMPSRTTGNNDGRSVSDALGSSTIYPPPNLQYVEHCGGLLESSHASASHESNSANLFYAHANEICGPEMGDPLAAIESSYSGTVYTSPESQYSQPSGYYSVGAQVGNYGTNSIYGQGGEGAETGIRVLRAEEDASQHLSHTTRASPATIQWLLENYETAEGVSLPRCTLYNHYLRHCEQNNLDPVNAASFGKLIRSVFLGLRTRRLGTRGNSKYHYYGIRIKPESALNRITEDNIPMALRQQPTSQKKNVGAHIERRSEGHGYPLACENAQASANAHVSSQMQPSQQQQPQQQQQQPPPSSHHPSASSTNSTNSYPESQFLSYLGSGSVPHVNTPTPDNHFIEIELTPDRVKRFYAAYENHCQEVLELIQCLKLSEVEGVWQRFWQPTMHHSIAVHLGPNEQSLESTRTVGLTRTQLTCGPILNFIKRMDLQFYRCLVDVLIPCVLRTIPNQLTQIIRNFAKGLEASMRNALQLAPEELAVIKLKAVSSFAQTLRRYTSLTHLAQAARGVLQNSQQVQLMVNDLNRVNFRDIMDQAFFVCECDKTLVQQVEMDFKAFLCQQRSLEEWAKWLDNTVDRFLAPRRTTDDLLTTARQFLLKWSFYSSMVIRDLTLRSATSFGSFHLIRLLYDEYVFYLVEHKIAESLGSTPQEILVRLEEGTLSDLMTNGNMDQITSQSLLGYSGHQNGDILVAAESGNRSPSRYCQEAPTTHYEEGVALETNNHHADAFLEPVMTNGSPVGGPGYVDAVGMGDSDFEMSVLSSNSDVNSLELIQQGTSGASTVAASGGTLCESPGKPVHAASGAGSHETQCSNRPMPHGQHNLVPYEDGDKNMNPKSSDSEVSGSEPYFASGENDEQEGFPPERKRQKPDS